MLETLSENEQASLYAVLQSIMDEPWLTELYWILINGARDDMDQCPLLIDWFEKLVTLNDYIEARRTEESKNLSKCCNCVKRNG